MKLQFVTVADTITGWDIMFPYKRDDAELAFLSAKFFKALAPLFSDESFVVAAGILEDEETTFPTIAHMRRLVNVASDRMARERSMQTISLPEETTLTPEEEKINLEKIEIIKQVLEKKMSMDEGVSKQEALMVYVAQ